MQPTQSGTAVPPYSQAQFYIPKYDIVDAQNYRQFLSFKWNGSLLTYLYSLTNWLTHSLICLQYATNQILYKEDHISGTLSTEEGRSQGGGYVCFSIISCENLESVMSIEYNNYFIS